MDKGWLYSYVCTDMFVCFALEFIFSFSYYLTVKFLNIPVSISGPKDDDFLLFWFRAVAEQQKIQSITLPKQSWPYGALMEAKCWLAACCSWVEDIFLHNDPRLRWGGQRWQWEAEAPGDARGSLVLFSVWALLAVFGNSEQKIKRKHREVFYCMLLMLRQACGRASSAASEMQQWYRGSNLRFLFKEEQFWGN